MKKKLIAKCKISTIIDGGCFLEGDQYVYVAKVEISDTLTYHKVIGHSVIRSMNDFTFKKYFILE